LGGITIKSMLLYNAKLKKHSQELRKNMTDAENIVSPRPSLEKRGIGFYPFPTHSISVSP
jgi:hypothetical protein